MNRNAFAVGALAHFERVHGVFSATIVLTRVILARYKFRASAGAVLMRLGLPVVTEG
jgi:hypothetical protein